MQKAAPRRRMPSGGVWFARVQEHGELQAVVKSLNSTESTNKTVSLIGEKFWSPQEIIDLCERLSGKKAKTSYIPFFAFGILQRFFRFFEFTWNISDRLQFGEIGNSPELTRAPSNEIEWANPRVSLEIYLQEYFGKILRKLKETNYQQSQKSNDISFLQQTYRITCLTLTKIKVCVSQKNVYP